MFEYIVKPLVLPVMWVIALLGIGVIFQRRCSSRSAWASAGWWCCFAAWIIVLSLSLKPVSNALLYTLESANTAVDQQEISRLDAVLVLGGGVSMQGMFDRSPEASGTTYSRLFNGVEVFKKSSAGILVLCGLGAKDFTVSEAAVMRDLALKLGVSSDNIVIEDRSLTTMGNALELRALGVVRDGMRVGIVTTALHMKRTLWTFRNVFPGVVIVPIPTGFSTSPFMCTYPEWVPNVQNFSNSTAAMYEWIGLAWYWYKMRNLPVAARC